MLFRKKIEKSCAYCTHGTKLNDDSILCAKQGIRLDDSGCWKFQYDPFKRIPARVKAKDFSKFAQEDFSL